MFLTHHFLQLTVIIHSKLGLEGEGEGEGEGGRVMRQWEGFNVFGTTGSQACMPSNNPCHCDKVMMHHHGYNHFCCWWSDGRRECCEGGREFFHIASICPLK